MYGIEKQGEGERTRDKDKEREGEERAEKFHINFEHLTWFSQKLLGFITARLNIRSTNTSSLYLGMQQSNKSLVPILIVVALIYDHFRNILTTALVAITAQSFSATSYHGYVPSTELSVLACNLFQGYNGWIIHILEMRLRLSIKTLRYYGLIGESKNKSSSYREVLDLDTLNLFKCTQAVYHMNSSLYFNQLNHLNIGNNKCYIINETTVKTLYTIKDTIDPHKPNETGFVSANECLLLSRTSPKTKLAMNHLGDTSICTLLTDNAKQFCTALAPEQAHKVAKSLMHGVGDCTH
uniref:Uncharacterized protein n=1 Tax=Glossina pallidipes TaxID=7398 RepID=A0A1A9ZI12_GLOPL